MNDGVVSKRRVALAIALLSVAGALSGCAKTQEPASAGGEPTPGGTLVLGSISDVDAWNEYVSAQSFAVSVLRRIFPPLALQIGGAVGSRPSFEPELAESWSVSDDGLAITFRLRDAVWSDGTAVTADDVRFTWQAQVSSEVGWTGAHLKSRIADVEVLDPRTVVFHFDRAYPDQMTDAVDGGIVPRHVFAQVPFSAWRTTDWSRQRIGAGPFLLAGYRPGEEIVLERNPRFYRPGLPRLDRVAVRIVPDIGNLVTQLSAGALDWVEGVPPQDAGRLESAPGIRLLTFVPPGFDYIGWNGGKPPFDDPEVRAALTAAIDRKAIVEDLLFGYGVVATGPVPAAWWGADTPVAPKPYDPESARRILATKGYGPDRPLAFEITTNAGNRTREAVLVKIQEQLGKVGVKASPRPLEMKAFREAIVNGRFDAYLAGWRFTSKIDLGSLFASGSVPPRGNNVVAYRSSDADRILRALDEAGTTEEIGRLSAELERRLDEDQPYTFLYELERIVAVGPRVRGAAVDVPSDPLARLERLWIAGDAAR